MGLEWIKGWITGILAMTVGTLAVASFGWFAPPEGTPLPSEPTLLQIKRAISKVQPRARQVVGEDAEGRAVVAHLYASLNEAEPWIIQLYTFEEAQ